MQNEKIEFNDIFSFFELINSVCKYIVLRNFEDFPEILTTSEHPDIDILCENAKQVASKLSLENSQNYNDYVHYHIAINGKDIDVDLREIGDGYYDSTWEKKILNNRVFSNKGFYVPDDTDYFYSLLYHALIQKKKLSDDYRQRLGVMARNVNVGLISVGYDNLNEFIRQNGYKYTYPKNPGTTFELKNVDPDLVEKNLSKKFARTCHKIKRKLRR